MLSAAMEESMALLVEPLDWQVKQGQLCRGGGLFKIMID